MDHIHLGLYRIILSFDKMDKFSAKVHLFYYGFDWLYSNLCCMDCSCLCRMKHWKWFGCKLSNLSAKLPVCTTVAEVIYWQAMEVDAMYVTTILKSNKLNFIEL